MTQVRLRRRRERLKRERIRKVRLKQAKAIAIIIFLFALFNLSTNVLGVGWVPISQSASFVAGESPSQVESGESESYSRFESAVTPSEIPISSRDEKIQKAGRSGKAEPSEIVPLDSDIQIQAIGWGEEYGVPYSMVLAVIEAESSFDADAVNKTCYGYMQINSILQDWLYEEIGVYDITDPFQNIHAGIFILGDFYSKYGDWNQALMCYNAGEQGAKDYYFSKGLTSSSYSEKVIEFEKKWSEVLENE